MKAWNLTEFSEKRMVFLLNFTNKLFVSSGKNKDLLDLEIAEPRIFKRKQSEIFMSEEEAQNNRMLIELQP